MVYRRYTSPEITGHGGIRVEQVVKENVNMKEEIESLLKDNKEVIFMKDNNNIGEITKYTPYKIVNLYESIYAHITTLELTYIGNRVYVTL